MLCRNPQGATVLGEISSWLLTNFRVRQTNSLSIPIFRHICYSQVLRAEHKPVTLQNVFSDENRDRVKQLLPKTRMPLRPGRSKDVKSQAAVLVPLCLVHGQPSVLFMKRSIFLNSHSGEICFPGGMKDDTDKDLCETAFRETHEEIGLDRDQVEVWEEMTPIPSKRDGNWMTPIVGLCGNVDLKDLKLNEKEVDEVFTVTIEAICDPANQRQTQWRFPGTAGYTMPVFLVGEHRIWGFTAIVLHMFMQLLAPGLYQFKLKHRR